MSTTGVTSRSSGQSQCCQHPPHNRYVQESDLSSKLIGLAVGQSFWSVALVKLILSVGQGDLCSKHGSIVDGGSKVSSKDGFVVREFGGVMVHSSVKPTKLVYSADIIGILSGHNSLWDLPGGHVNAVRSRARANH